MSNNAGGNLRIACVVDGCRRTMGIDTARKRFGFVPAEWLCHSHWARLTRAERRVWYRFLRLEKPGIINPAAYDRIWSALRRRCQ